MFANINTKEQHEKLIKAKDISQIHKIKEFTPFQTSKTIFEPIIKNIYECLSKIIYSSDASKKEIMIHHEFFFTQSRVYPKEIFPFLKEALKSWKTIEQRSYEVNLFNLLILFFFLIFPYCF